MASEKKFVYHAKQHKKLFFYLFFASWSAFDWMKKIFSVFLSYRLYYVSYNFLLNREKKTATLHFINNNFSFFFTIHLLQAKNNENLEYFHSWFARKKKYIRWPKNVFACNFFSPLIYISDNMSAHEIVFDQKDFFYVWSN